METAYLQGVNLIVRERNYNSYNTETAEFRHLKAEVRVGKAALTIIL